MSFISRAYHAMARQRPMSTKTGVPTAATYVFVNMLRKLRTDFNPEYLAAVFDVAGPTFRDEQAKAVTSVQKFDIKTQTFQQIAYHGYKANRAEMPQDLAQQVPYIRRALEAYRIPILEQRGFEADDVIGTLARKAAEQSYQVFVVSSDKDMLQLVNQKICVLNPTKDNLICDAAKVEEILGVRPEQVIDVMALRGDSIDNIPGAPGIGDKGSVDIIKRFGTLEAALDRASEVEKKTYRESLLNHRAQIIYSKQQVTIDTHVPVELDLKTMEAQPPDAEAARRLFSELEFTTLLGEVAAPSADLGKTNYARATSEKEVEQAIKQADKNGLLSLAFEFPAAHDVNAKAEEELAEQSDNLPLVPPSLASGTVVPPPDAAISPVADEALTRPQDDPPEKASLAAALSDPHLPKAVHDYKDALRTLGARGIELAGIKHDPSLYSYLLNPTYSNHSLDEIALRTLSLNLSDDLAQRADLTGRLSAVLGKQVERGGLKKVYEEIDLPLMPVLARMEDAGVNIDCDVLAEMSQRLD